ncbi:MAG: hypothetical protein ACK50Q_00050 [Labrys sp. (in: a-proteobacteria)]|jgi:hypothetical protein
MDGDPESRAANWSPRDLLIALTIGLVAFLVFNANMRAIPAGDTYAARYLPFSLLKNHTVLIDPIVETVAQGRRPPMDAGDPGTAFWIKLGRDGRLVSYYPVLLPVVITPLYIPAMIHLDGAGWDPFIVDSVARVMEKLVASSIAALSVGLLYGLLRRRAPPSIAASLSLVYAFGTTTWVISSQALWAHGLGQLLIIATMLAITGRPTAMRAAMAGLFCAMIAANRQPDAVLAAALGFYGLWWAGTLRLRAILVLAGLVPVALTLAYNLAVVGHVAGAYALSVRPQHFNADVPGGVAGLLFSPTRGLFVFSPFLLFLPCLLLIAVRDTAFRGLNMAITAAVAAQILFYAMVDWRQGISWGPRWLTDMLPLLMWLLVPIVSRLAAGGRVLFAAACAVAVAIQATGAFFYTGATDLRMLQGEGPDRMRPMWQFANAPFLGAIAAGPAPRDLFSRLRGNVDLVEVIGDGPQRQIDIAGWALIDDRSPSGVSVLIDGVPAGGTNSFLQRPDVVQATGVAQPSGWRVQVPIGSLAPGRHTIAALVHGSDGDEPRLLRQTTFTIAEKSRPKRADGSLDDMAARAMEILTSRQSPEGYWLTQFTSGTVFDAPREEMNTYLNAVMIDIAGPLATAGPLSGAMASARRFLTSQIEADGLVRYHGRPDAPGIGVLGCEITPDSDDTALVWRIAPSPDNALRAAAMATLQRYRRADGLYRTWLADPSAYRCIDPGRDPNPADIGIQMHVFMLLAQQNPPAARDLCAAMIRHVGDETNWVYYANAPLLVALRLSDMRRDGCPLDLPEARLQRAVPGQDVWMRVAAVLRRFDERTANMTTMTEAQRLLRQIAADDFALLHETPPLFYHNDLTASVRRFYWSQDLGYLLWLRLLHETRAVAPLPDRTPQAGSTP